METVLPTAQPARTTTEKLASLVLPLKPGTELNVSTVVIQAESGMPHQELVSAPLVNFGTDMLALSALTEELGT